MTNIARPRRVLHAPSITTFDASGRLIRINHKTSIDRIGNRIGSCVANQFGIPGLLGILGIATGAPVIPKGKGAGAFGSGRYTSLASKRLSKALPQKLPLHLPAPTFHNPVARTAVLGRFVGRWTPILGWGLLISDVYDIAKCVADGEDKVPVKAQKNETH